MIDSRPLPGRPAPRYPLSRRLGRRLEPHEDAAIVEAYTRGELSAVRIAIEGWPPVLAPGLITRHQVLRVLHRHGIVPRPREGVRPWCENRVRRVIEFRAKGKSLKDAARALGITDSALHNWLRRNCPEVRARLSESRSKESSR